jgi:hypothetical protein
MGAQVVAGAGWPSPVDRQRPVAGPMGELRSSQIAPGDLIGAQLVSARLFRCCASGRLGLTYSEVLQMRQQSLKTADADLAGSNPASIAKMKKPVPLGPALFIFW